MSPVHLPSLQTITQTYQADMLILGRLITNDMSALATRLISTKPLNGYHALSLTSDGDPDWPARLANIGVFYTTQFLRSGKLDDLDQAIVYEARALAVAPNNHPCISLRPANLGAAYGERFAHLGELDDLDKAIDLESRAVDLTPDGHPQVSHRLTNLVASYNARFRYMNELNDLDKAIEYGIRAVTLVGDDHPDLPSHLANLGMTYSLRSQCLGGLNDLDKAIEYESRALSLTPDDHSDLPRRYINLGVSYGKRFARSSQMDDLDKAIRHGSRALALTPAGHPKLSLQYNTLARFHLLQYERTSDPPHLQLSLHYHRSAANSLAAAPRDRFMYAYDWAMDSSKNCGLNCMEAYQVTIDLLPQFIWLGATLNQRYSDLLTVEDLATKAACSAIRTSNYGLALEWLDHGRCVVWNQYLMLRSPLDQLHHSDPALATQIQTTAEQLHRVSSESRSSKESFASEQSAQQHRQLAQKYNDLIAQARTSPDFENFLSPIKANGLVQTARNGHIIVINCHEDCCDALIITAGKDRVDHLPLPNFDGKKAQSTRLEMEKSVRNSRSRERGVERLPILEQTRDFENALITLWYNVVKPVLDYIGHTSKISNDNLPHITWCPTGALSFLPLHAAGDYNKPRSRVFDYVISSYTPTLTALLSCTPSTLTHDSRVLAIGQAHTPGHNPLPGTAVELAYIQTHTSGKVEYTQLEGDQATTNAVLDEMENHDWVHLACHADQNVQHPEKSGFYLHDGILDLASINRQSFKNKGLAYLSACQTATGDKNLPDEAIHLASGMLMAGYSSVIATMWSVLDSDAPLVADKVYGELMKEGKIGNGEVGRALHNAVSELREKVGEEAFERWVPYIHIGS